MTSTKNEAIAATMRQKWREDEYRSKTLQAQRRAIDRRMRRRLQDLAATAREEEEENENE